MNTAIDKNNSFDLLNMSIPPQKLKPKIGKINKFNYEYHAKILKLHKLLLEDLKLTLLHHRNVASEHVQKVDVVGCLAGTAHCRREIKSNGSQSSKNLQCCF